MNLEKHVLFIALFLTILTFGVILLNESMLSRVEEQRQTSEVLTNKMIRMDSTIKQQQKFIDSVRTVQPEEFTWHRSP